MDKLWQDLKYSIRTMIRAPGFAAMAVLTLGLGIGANTAFFSVVNGVLLRPLPFAHPEQLVFMQEYRSSRAQDPLGNVSAPDFMDWRAQSRSFQQFVAFDERTAVITGEPGPDRLPAAWVSPAFFQMLQIPLHLGRGFQADEEKFGNHRVVVLSHEIWQRRYLADPNIVGRILPIHGHPHTVIGVMPPGFQFTSQKTDLWLPFAFSSDDLVERGAHYFVVIARRRAGVSIEQAQAEMSEIAARLEAQYPENKGHGVRVTGLRENMVGDFRGAMWILLGAVGLILLIACANVAGLMLSRAMAREREIAVRVALGAGRWRLARQFLTESLLLAVVAGALGVLLAVWGTDTLVALGADRVPRLHEVSVDGASLAFTLAASLFSALLFGLVPVLQATGPQLQSALKEGSAGAGSSRQWTRNVLVASEIALAVVLLVGSGLLLQSFLRMMDEDPGFRPQNVFTFRLSLPETKYLKEEQQAAFFDQALRHVRELPGVTDAAAIAPLPMGGSTFNLSVILVDRGETFEDRRPAFWRIVSPGYFQTMRIPLRKGRVFNEHDQQGRSCVILINETMRKALWQDREPLGERIQIGYNDIVCEIVGVVGDVRHRGLDLAGGMEMYTPMAQVPLSGAEFVVRTSGDPLTSVSDVRRVIQKLDPDLPVVNVRTMEELVARAGAQRRYAAMLMGLFAAAALLLAAVGLYGVINYAVGQRTREIGLRLAFGAQRRDILRLILGHGAGLGAVGLLAGVGAALAATRLMRAMLYQVEPNDLLTYASVTTVLALVTLVACWIPARRAARVDPMIALRYE